MAATLILLSPRFFFYKSNGDIAIASVHPTVHLTVMLSSPKPWDEIQPKLLCELLTSLGVCENAHFLPPPPPVPLVRGQNVHLFVRLSGCPSCYLLLNLLTKTKQILCGSFSHKWGVKHYFFCHTPPPAALGRDKKRRIS